MKIKTFKLNKLTVELLFENTYIINIAHPCYVNNQTVIVDRTDDLTTAKVLFSGWIWVMTNSPLPKTIEVQSDYSLYRAQMYGRPLYI